MTGLAEEHRHLVGVWKLQTYDVEFQDTGERKTPFGANPNGYIIFTLDGRMMATLSAEGRKSPQTDADRVAAFRSMIAYSGIYRLQDDRWITKVDTAWDESLVGTEQIRHYRLEGATLIVTTPWGSFVNFDGRVVQAILTWVKTK